ncbi:hypothetical protein, variant 1 [Aphanomyces invadans]|uniref:Uncharacterized protein n=1 Tax=Aphanomyces invadans TaxID=157072 RepID=A0A024US21_9STRA|nr:hypothetical protein, variant 1 [Aphanomyces invadans]ETW09281.1 hypothetical protein, variant 1 [Aphanomyces invadans]|eukprot:XP_008863086.1 hypothetical protein, variant 1 [Aphanomyces invadans]
MTEPDFSCRKKWLEQDRENRIKLQNLRDSLRATIVRAGNFPARGAKPRLLSPKRINSGSPATSDNALSSQGSTSDDKENVHGLHGSVDTPSKKRRLTQFLAASRPNKASISLKDIVASASLPSDMNEASTKSISEAVNEVLSKRLMALEATLKDVVTQNSVDMTHVKRLEARNADLFATNTALESRNTALSAQVESMAATFQATLAQISLRQELLVKEQTEALRTKYEAQISDLTSKLTTVTSKFDAIREDVDLKCNDRAGVDIMPLLDSLEEQLFQEDDGDVLEDARSVLLPALKKRLREYAVWVKTHDEERQLLQFSNQVYLQQINELQQKNVALNAEVAEAQQRAAYIVSNASSSAFQSILSSSSHSLVGTKCSGGAARTHGRVRTNNKQICIGA